MQIKRLSYFIFLSSAVLSFISLLPISVEAQAREKIVNNSERDTIAIGHYSRARALLIEAIAEFEIGKTVSDPSLIIDSERWRGSLVVRAEELNRIIEPKPRITRSGVEYGANSKLLGTNLPSQKDYLGAQTQETKKTTVKKKVNVKGSGAVTNKKNNKVVEKSSEPTVSEITKPIETTTDAVRNNVQELEKEIANIRLDDSDDFGATKEGVKEEVKVGTGNVATEFISDTTNKFENTNLSNEDIEREIARAIDEKLGDQ